MLPVWDIALWIAAAASVANLLVSLRRAATEQQQAYAEFFDSGFRFLGETASLPGDKEARVYLAEANLLAFEPKSVWRVKITSAVNTLLRKDAYPDVAAKTLNLFFQDAINSKKLHMRRRPST